MRKMIQKIVLYHLNAQDVIVNSPPLAVTHFLEDKL